MAPAGRPPLAGETTVVADDLVRPNGLIFSPDEARLYLSDTGNLHDPDGLGHIRVFEVVEGRLGVEEVWRAQGRG